MMTYLNTAGVGATGKFRVIPTPSRNLIDNPFKEKKEFIGLDA